MGEQRINMKCLLRSPRETVGPSWKKQDNDSVSLEYVLCFWPFSVPTSHHVDKLHTVIKHTLHPNVLPHHPLSGKQGVKGP